MTKTEKDSQYQILICLKLTFLSNAVDSLQQQ